MIAYLQIKENYYVLSNSIANKSTTIGIECEMISSDIYNPSRVVVQVKAIEGKINLDEYIEYSNDGYKVYFYDGGRDAKSDEEKHFFWISKSDLESFYNEYRNILPSLITRWE